MNDQEAVRDVVESFGKYHKQHTYPFLRYHHITLTKIVCVHFITLFRLRD